MNRRDMLVLTGSLAVGLSALPRRASAATTVPAGFKGPYIDLTTPKGNVNAAARIDANLDESKQKWASVSGVVCGVREGGPIKDLFGFEVVSVARAWAQPDGSYRVPHREAIFYTDLATGDVLRTWNNPYIDEEVEVVDVINDPWNHFYAEEVKRFEPEYGGLNKPKPKPPVPFTNGFFDAGHGMVQNRRHINLYYKAALQPDTWPRESAGPMNQVSEFFTSAVKLADLQDPEKTSVHHTGSWSRVTPWLPWMLMGQAPGNCLYACFMGTADHPGDVLPRPVMDYAEKHYAKYFEAPTVWTPEGLSSLENYKKTQKPAPVKS